MNDLIEKLSNLRSQFNCFNENERDAYNTLSEAIKVISERPEPCEDDKHCSNCMYSGRPTYKSPCSECRDKSQWEMKPFSRSHENGTECEDAVSRKELLKFFSNNGEGSWTYDTVAIGYIKALPSVMLKPDHIGDATEMVEYDDCVSRQAVADVAYKVGNLFDGEDDTRTPYGVAFDIQMAVDKLPPVMPKQKREPIRAVDANAMMKRLKTWDTNDVTDKALYNFALNRVLEAPTICPERKTGKWIHGIVNNYTVNTYCSECGESAPFVLVSDDYYGVHVRGEFRETDFCPSCGADMKGKQDER